MSAGASDIIPCAVGLLFPYCFFMQFNPPYDLQIDTLGMHQATARLCKLIWPLIVGASLISGGAALAWVNGLTMVAIGLGSCALLLRALLFVPGIAFYKRAHRLE